MKKKISSAQTKIKISFKLRNSFKENSTDVFHVHYYVQSKSNNTLSGLLFEKLITSSLELIQCFFRIQFPVRTDQLIAKTLTQRNIKLFDFDKFHCTIVCNGITKHQNSQNLHWLLLLVT